MKHAIFVSFYEELESLIEQTKASYTKGIEVA